MNYKILFTDLDDTVFDSSSLYKQAIELSWEHLRKFYNISLDDFQRVFLEIRTSLKTEYVHKTISHHRVVLFEKLLEYFKIPFNAGLLLEMDRTYWFCVNTY